jgi:hypothetical protein
MTPTREELEALLERLEGATEGSRELSDAVLEATNPYRSGPYANFKAAAVAFGWDVHVSTSIDAAVALIGRVLPGWGAIIYTSAPYARVRNPATAADFGASAPAPALALCIALVKAKLAEIQP